MDAYALIFRSYYAFIRNPRFNSKGLNTSAIFGFTNTLIEVLNKENPSHIAVVFDPPGPTFRNDIYEEYKANREETPEDIKKSVPFIKKIIEGFNIECIEIEGFEADDVIGTLSKKAVDEGFEVYMMTPDKDYAQLVDENVYMYKPGRAGGDHEILNVQKVKEKFNVDNPLQVIDFLALMGDSSDNVPGAKGIGEKTAQKLIGTYKNIQNLFEGVDDMKGKLKEKIIDSKENIELSKQLVTIDRNVPVQFDAVKMRKGEANQEALQKVFNQLEFRTIAQRLFNQDISKKSPKDSQQQFLFESADQSNTPGKQLNANQSINDQEHDYQLVEEEEEIKKLVTNLQNQKEFCFDTETTGLNVFQAELIGIAFSYKAKEAYYIPFPQGKKDIIARLELIKPALENKAIRKIGQNLKYDIHILKNYGVEVNGEFFDTMVAHYLLQPELKHNMDFMAEQYLQYRPVSIESLIGKKGINQRSMRSVSLEKLVEYACEDADITFQLYEILRGELKTYRMEQLAGDMEMPLIKVLFHMERNGIKIDTDALHQYAGVLREQIIKIEKEIYELAGNEEFNISSPKQLGEVLFEKLKIVDKPRKTKTKQYATSEEVLEKMIDKHPIINKILEYRGLKKLLSTYVEALPNYINPSTGKIHTTYNQALVATGRLSSDHPNLQNIPVRDESGRPIRKSFIPSNEQSILMAADYSQIELRLMAHLSKDEQLLEAFRNEADIHTATAAKIYNIKPEEVNADMRRKAKTANFGIIYGISPFGLAQRLNIPRGEAKELIEGYFSSYPAVKKYMDQAIIKSKENGYVETIFGRRRYLKDIFSNNSVVRGYAERNAINAPIQGSAADIIKMAMNEIETFMYNQELRSKLVMQVHDELVFDVWKDEQDILKKQVKDIMEHIVKLDVPLIVDIGLGNNWLESH